MAAADAAGPAGEIDDSLYSRQRYVLGDGAMQRMARSRVLVCGAGGVGIEVAKNVVLAGVRALTLHDDRAASMHDLGTQFYLEEGDVGKNRAVASAPRLAELNPYVMVEASSEPLTADYLRQFQCVVLTETTLEKQLEVNQLCRAQKPPIRFITADVRGVFALGFVDFGPEFEVVDATGEAPRQVLLSDISRAEEAVVTTIEKQMHGFEDGDQVEFREVQGMVELNSERHTVKVLTPHTFSIGDTRGHGEYRRSGTACQLVRKKVMNFESLAHQIKSPKLLMTDYAKIEAPGLIFSCFLALDDFQKTHGRFPTPGDTSDADGLLRLREHRHIDSVTAPLSAGDECMVRKFAWTCGGALPPLCAALGGWMAQEALKGLTGKFTPLDQVLCFDMAELAPATDGSTDATNYLPLGDRYDALRACIGQPMVEKLAQARLFMVGCGAIGCEMLKNYALLGVGTAGSGQLIITDNDIIEKSNLNRQFLFRPEHIRSSKSEVAAASVRRINPALRIEPHQHKVGPETTKTVYTDAFFDDLDVVVNALDNVQARLFMDMRCVSTQRPLLESGTMGTKGHVQVVVPHLTESYASQRDPPETEVPYCTLKSFPVTIDHTIQWARDKFANLFELKPAEYNKFWSDNGGTEAVLAAMASNDCGKSYDSAGLVLKLAQRTPRDWNDCIVLARTKFEKYFNHKAQHLLRAFPIDTKLADGTDFWQSPKRPPTALAFDSSNALHIDFIRSTAFLLAHCYGIEITDADLAMDAITVAATRAPVPEFRPKGNYKVETDESVKKEQAPVASGIENFATVGRSLQEVLTEKKVDAAVPSLVRTIFEKDDDSNGHIDFITAASNLRATMYGIAPVDRLKTKLVAGKIVPAIATTTAAVSGLVSAELIKVLRRDKLDQYRNTFLNLALPFMLLTEPAEPVKETLVGGLTYTLWDRWDVQGNREMTLAEFMKEIEVKFGAKPCGVVNGLQLVFMPTLPMHQKRLVKPMRKLLKPAKGAVYTDLAVTLIAEDGAADGDSVSAPPVRYFY